jgi:hypothetical protein
MRIKECFLYKIKAIYEEGKKNKKSKYLENNFYEMQ